MEHSYKQRAGAIFRSIINDLKRNDKSAAEELGVSIDSIKQIIAGEDFASPSIIEKAVKIWPVNERDFSPIHDDTPDGVIIKRVSESAATARILARGNRDYYEYRDTAMSRIVSIRPEWIKMLHYVNNNDPENSTVQWNNGHLLYQFTYFIGPVNFYYSWNGQNKCVEMHTGDSVFILPFVHHSFASRSRDSDALILALTYGGKLSGDAQHELSAIGRNGEAFALNGRSTQQLASELLLQHMNNGSYSVGYLSTRSGIPESRIDCFLTSEDSANLHEMTAMADAMHVSVRELIPTTNDADDGVIIQRFGDSSIWRFPDDESHVYQIRECAASRVTGFSKSLEIQIAGKGENRDRGVLYTSLHEYGFNHGSEAVVLSWINKGCEHSTVIEPGDSVYIKPFVRHWLSRTDGHLNAAAKVLLLRVGGKIVGDGTFEATAIGCTGIRRVAFDNDQWYDE